MTIRTIAVGCDSKDADGNDYTVRASRKAVRAGWMVNVPVRLRYPDGSERDGVEARYTPKGLEELRRIMPVQHRPVAGRA